MKLKGKIISVSPEQSGLRRDGSKWRTSQAIISTEEKDSIIVRAWDNESDFCQTYDLSGQPAVVADLQFEVETSVKFGDRKYQSCVVRAIQNDDGLPF